MKIISLCFDPSLPFDAKKSLYSEWSAILYSLPYNKLSGSSALQTFAINCSYVISLYKFPISFVITVENSVNSTIHVKNSKAFAEFDEEIDGISVYLSLFFSGYPKISYIFINPSPTFLVNSTFS